MTRQPLVAKRAEELLGTSVVATAPIAGGDIATATKLRLSDGTTAVMKTHPHAPPRFFESEAAGLRWLAEAEGGVAVPEVLGVDHECLVLRWVEPVRISVDAAASFGTALAATHRPAPRRTGTPTAETATSAGCRCPASPATPGRSSTPPGGCCPTSSWRATGARPPPPTPPLVESVLGRLADLVPVEPPARLHGDLWNGNVLWGAEGRAWLIDPAAHGGHRETDLAMLSLFGLPHLARVLEAYDAAAPLAEGWESRQGLHQLFPLLVHACHFGGGYAARAAETASRYV